MGHVTSYIEDLITNWVTHIFRLSLLDAISRYTGEELTGLVEKLHCMYGAPQSIFWVASLERKQNLSTYIYIPLTFPSGMPISQFPSYGGFKLQINKSPFDTAKFDSFAHN